LTRGPASAAVGEPELTLASISEPTSEPLPVIPEGDPCSVPPDDASPELVPLFDEGAPEEADAPEDDAPDDVAPLGAGELPPDDVGDIVAPEEPCVEPDSSVRSGEPCSGVGRG